MAVRIGEEPCPKAKNNRPCIFKTKKVHPMGDGIRKKIEGCVRCGNLQIADESITNMECPLSKNGKHQWVKNKTLSFKQHNRFQRITHEELCPDCGAKQIREFNLDIPYNPHPKK